MDLSTDEIIVERALTGDAEAFGEIVRRWERRIFALTYGMLGREEDARDATQETFLAAFRNLPRRLRHRSTVRRRQDVSPAAVAGARPSPLKFLWAKFAPTVALAAQAVPPHPTCSTALAGAASSAVAAASCPQLAVAAAS